MRNKNSFLEFCRDLDDDESVGIMYIDVNFLKQINDALGHRRGDFLIQLVVDRINAACAEQGSEVFRVGGDEFVVVLHGADRDACEARAASLAGDLLNDDLPDLPRVLASLGWSWSEHASDIQHLVYEADASMYAAKRRDRAVCQQGGL